MKIDTNSIENFETMSAEEKLNAVLGLELPDDNSAELAKIRNQLSNANSEAKKWKEAHNKLLSDEERKKNEEAEELESYKKRVAELEKKESLSTFKSQFMAQGFDEELAAKAAEAYYNREDDKFFKIQKDFLTAHDKAYAAELIKNTPNPKEGSGIDASGLTKEQFRKLSPSERHKFQIEHPEEYKRLYER